MLRRRGPENLAVAFTGPGRVELVSERLPRPRRGQLLLEASCSLISTGTERRCLQRDFAPGSHWDEWVTYPFRPGYSFVGATADGNRFCAPAPHARYALVEEEHAIPVPDGIGDEQASWFALASIAQLGVAAAPIAPGDPVVVIGAGVLGQLVAQLARRAGAGTVIVVARSRPRLDVALAHGADAAVEAGAEAAREEVLRRTGGEGAAVVFEVTGSEPVFAAALRLARRHGTVVLVGDAGDPGEQRLGPELLLEGLRVVGAHYDHSDPAGRRRMATEFFAALADGGVSVDGLVSERVRPADAPAVYASLTRDDPRRLGVLFEWRVE